MYAYQLGRLIPLITRDSCTKGNERYFFIYLLRNGHILLFKKVLAQLNSYYINQYYLFFPLQRSLYGTIIFVIVEFI